jgi:hypothetical protein
MATEAATALAGVLRAMFDDHDHGHGGRAESPVEHIDLS